jgi:tetratricopeptide (TPR) repeat protein
VTYIHDGRSPVTENAEKLIGAIARSWSAGDTVEAVTRAQRLAPDLLRSPDTAATLGGMCASLGELAAAGVFYERAWQLAPQRCDIIKLYSGALVAAGEFATADALLERALSLQPNDAEAWFARAHAGRQSPERDLIGPMQQLLTSGTPSAEERVFLHYALGKCYDDLREFDAAYANYRSAASTRRSQLRYDAPYDRQVLADIAAQLTSGPDHRDDSEVFRPIFVVGLPRSGTTLLERMLASHSNTCSIGESTAFTKALTQTLEVTHPGRRLSRRDAVSLSLSIDHHIIGHTYRKQLPPGALSSERLVDKMPLNFLYIGLIRRALPGSRVLILRRQPMANGWSIFSTLFRKAYPWSYDFREIAAYYASFSRLANRVEEAFPETVRRVDYERLATQPEDELRRILEFLDMSWEDACMSFHRNPTPTATASLEQVRRPVYRTSIERWRQYPQLAGELGTALRNEGISDV